MESTPKGLNVAQMVRDIVRQPGIQDVHDLHVWSIAGGMTALSAHVQMEDRPLRECDPLLDRLSTMLRTRYRIGHTTIQVECAGCETNHLYCAMSSESEGTRDHEREHDYPHGHKEPTDGLDLARKNLKA
jgi:cobalt-zinc-cadmium efflux system protein